MNTTPNNPIRRFRVEIMLAGMILSLCFAMSGSPAARALQAWTVTPAFAANREIQARGNDLAFVEPYQIVSCSDFDGDGKTDPAKFVPSSGTVWWLMSSTGSWDGQWLGGDVFQVVPGSDFDGDGKSDPAKFYASLGTVWWVKSSTGTLDGQWLGPDLFTYVTGSDFDGDGKSDPAKFYPETGTVWWVKSSTGLLDGKWLGPDLFTYVTGSDFDGDGKSDPAKFYPATGTVWWIKSSTGTIDGMWLGPDKFTYVPASDFDGDGKTDPAKFYPETGTVWWVKSSTGSMDGVWLGGDTFAYVPGCDFDGDGRTDPAKFYADSGMLWWLKSSTGIWDTAELGVATPDTTPPAAILDLAATAGSSDGSVNLTWTAPGEDDTTGTATSYLVRTNTSAILTETDWTNAGPVTTGIPTPQAAGSHETMIVSGLTIGTTYYFSVRAQDEVPNLGSLSNSPGTMPKGPPAAIAVNDFADYQVFQRAIGGASKSVSISGTYANMNWDHVEASVLQHGTDTAVIDWTSIDSTPGGGTFSGNLTVPQGGWYNVEVRALDSTGSVIGSSRGTHKWGVGMIILVIGQSNMSGRGQAPFTAANSDLAVNYNNAGTWEHLADPYDDESPASAVDYDNNLAAGSMIPGIANSLLQSFDFPIAFVPASKGGSNLYVNGSNYGWAYRNPSNHFDTSTLYGQSITKAQSVGGVELIIMHQGEADLSAGRTEANYEADFATMIGHYRQDLYAEIPIFICQLGTVGGGTDAGVTGIRSAQHDLDNGTNIFMGATAMEMPRIDAWHYDTPALTVVGTRLANAIKYYFGQSTYSRGPFIASASFSDASRNQVIVTLNHRGGTDITPATGITGFGVFDNGVNVSITSAVRYTANSVRLTLSSSISSGHTVTLRYLWGMTPNVSGLVKDNTPLALPLENTTADLTVSGLQLP